MTERASTLQKMCALCTKFEVEGRLLSVRDGERGLSFGKKSCVDPNKDGFGSDICDNTQEFRSSSDSPGNATIWDKN